MLRRLAGYCQVKLFLARLDVSLRQKTPLYRGFLSSGSRASPWISVELTKPTRRYANNRAVVVAA